MIDFLLGIVWYILPAYIANASPVLLGGKTPIDLGIKFLDGRRLLGKGKTVKGFVFAVLVGAAVGAAQGYAEGNVLPRAVLGLLLGLGAMTGDSLGSFIKRRFALKPGEGAPLLDQWGFMVCGFALHWLGRGFTTIPFPTELQLLALLVFTPFIHIGTNVIAHRLKLKSVPW